MEPNELKRRRKALGLSQEQLAVLLDVDEMTVSRWERGVHPIPKYIELAVEALEWRRREAA
ncbi:MAG TPA: helix-turn-helix domain-containing protein [Pyrinomonadaceae bacterium]|jgi:transcriptional regulator with XRE-family HTH domain|nr:helix-turn-helix domain-containing protein [Pyrinomonadaceae bacterium]